MRVLSMIAFALCLLHACSKPTPPEEKEGRARAWLNQTAYFFNGDLAISLWDTRYNGSLKVYATIRSGDHTPATINGEQVGFRTTYEGKDIYKIEISAVDKTNVWFYVTRDKREPTP